MESSSTDPNLAQEELFDWSIEYHNIENSKDETELIEFKNEHFQEDSKPIELKTSDVTLLNLPSYEFLKKYLKMTKHKYTMIKNLTVQEGEFDFSKCEDIADHTEQFYNTYGY